MGKYTTFQFSELLANRQILIISQKLEKKKNPNQHKAHQFIWRVVMACMLLRGRLLFMSDLKFFYEIIA